MSSEKITMAHGSGGKDSHELMTKILAPHFHNKILDKMEDAAVLEIPNQSKIVVSTDSFVVRPIEFKGGDIGKLAVCGSVNDVLMMGATPKYITCAAILETGLDFEVLERIIVSMAAAAKEADVFIVAGDTKVIEHAGDDSPGLIINTTCVGILEMPIIEMENLGDPTAWAYAYTAKPPQADGLKAGDKIIVSGNLGDHHACILSARMGTINDIKSDCAVLKDITDSLKLSGIHPHAMRDVTRGGLATVLNELAGSSKVNIEVDEKSLPVDDEVRAFCGIMGLDPLYMGNEGKMIVVVSEAESEAALAAIQATPHGKDARMIATVVESAPPLLHPSSPIIADSSSSSDSQNASPVAAHKVYAKTKIGGKRIIDVLYGEGLPRIC
ncbi:MAG: hydrogenase expression/formation protein HypE [Clostridiales Family XIII bacterium]|jgi:hydrogenase expression/formation protein HypE|nr:hydrogenase expression/formation protein HypE [Clostridiales Family XIII bacterium]